MTSTNLAWFPSDLQRICRLSGTEKKLLRDKLLTLEDLERGLEQTLREAESTAATANRMAYGEVVLRVVATTANLAVSIWGSAILGRVYSQAQLLAKSLSGGFGKNDGLKMLFDNKLLVTEQTAKTVGSAAAERATKAVGAAVDISLDIYEGAGSWQDSRDTQQSLRSAAGSVRSQLERLRQKIRELRAALAEC